MNKGPIRQHAGVHIRNPKVAKYVIRIQETRLNASKALDRILDEAIADPDIEVSEFKALIVEANLRGWRAHNI